LINLEIEEEIEKNLDRIIERGEQLVDQNPSVLKKGESQMRNLIEIASATDSVRAFKVFVRYQIGRKNLPNDFGEALIKEIDGLENLAKEIVKDDPEKLRKVRSRLIRLFLGYMQRHFVYRMKTKTLKGGEKK